MGRKAYLSAILDLGDNSIVSYVLGTSNNKLVFDTLYKAILKKLKGMAPLEYRFHTLAA